MLKKIALSLSLCALVAYSAVNYPYPQRKLYGNGTINAVNSTADTDLKAKFQSYVQSFYVEGNCSGNNDCARIKFYDPDKPGDADFTVSEGIGYAMIMMVYFSDNNKSYETEFNKLWKYYQKWTNQNGLMNWKINGFSGVAGGGQNAASDAEFDVALALAMARHQFGNAQYENDAKSLIAKIRQFEFESNGLHKPGDAWANDRNPSYVSPAAFQIFKELEGNQNTFWDNALSVNYSLLTTNQNSATGLPSGWSNDNGNPKVCSNNCGNNTANYDQDAVRAPWRWAWANAWYGHQNAKTLLTKLATWVNQQDAAGIKGPIGLTGTMGQYPSVSYSGSLMCALTHSSTYQGKLNSFFSYAMGAADASYFNQSIQILTGLLVSGNMPNLKECAAGNCGTNMGGTGPSDGTSTVLDRLAQAGSETEDDRSYAATWENWYAYTDVNADDGNGGKALSTITNATFTAQDANNNCAEVESYRVILQEGSDWAVKIPSYTLNRGTYEYEPFVALGLDARKNGKPESQGGYDLSKCTDGFSYKYKGSAHKFKVLSSAIAEGTGSDHFKNFTTPSTSDWADAVVPPDELAQPSWVATASRIPFDLEKVRGWAWELTGIPNKGTTGLSANTGSFAIKDFRCLGNMPLPATKPASPCGGDSPIKYFPSQTSGNGIYAINNGVNLQVANNATLQVFDLKGNAIRTIKHAQSRSYNFSDLPRGLYIIKATSASWQQTVKMTVN